jgi:hypothetical protein
MYRHPSMSRVLSAEPHSTRTTRLRTGLMALLLSATGATAAHGQTESLRLVASPTAVEVVAGRTAPLTVTVVDGSGAEVDVAVRFAAPRSVLRYRDGVVQGYQAG